MTPRTKQPDVTLEKLLEVGAHFGHESRRWNPKMAPYIYSSRDGVHVFDLAKTRKALLEAAKAVREVAQEGGTILFVGTKRQARDLVAQAAEKVGMPHVTQRWLGGTITNFEQIGRSIRSLKEKKEAREKGEYKEYTKKEQHLIDKEIARLERLLGGIATLEQPPDMLFVVDTHKEQTAVKEAGRKGIKVAGIVDTNSDPEQIEYPIPANDDATKAISYILDTVVQAIEEGKKNKK